MGKQSSSFGLSPEAKGNGSRSSAKDTLSTCDSSSEVSDEGYKSSQGNVGNSASPNGGRTMTELSNKSVEEHHHEGIEKNDIAQDLLALCKTHAGDLTN